MKIKQVLFTVAISALTTIAVIWGYGAFVKKNNTYAGQEAGMVPGNYKYAGLLDGGTPPGGTLDFTAPVKRNCFLNKYCSAIPNQYHI